MNPLEIGIEASRTLHAMVGGEATPLKNMKYERQFGLCNSQYKEKKHVPNHQPGLVYHIYI